MHRSPRATSTSRLDVHVDVLASSRIVIAGMTITDLAVGFDRRDLTPLLEPDGLAGIAASAIPQRDNAVAGPDMRINLCVRQVLLESRYQLIGRHHLERGPLLPLPPARRS
jgi:hypothetical protein